MSEYTIVNDNDGNNSLIVTANNVDEAAHKALQELGYWVSTADEGDEQEEIEYPIINGKEWIGGSLQGYIDISYAELIEKLGAPSENFDDYKSDAEWTLKFEDGTGATIYNYKTGKNYCGAEGLETEDIRDWHIGGESKKAVEKVFEYFGMEVPA
jgi:hypothetical protein